MVNDHNDRGDNMPGLNEEEVRKTLSFIERKLENMDEEEKKIFQKDIDAAINRLRKKL